MLILEYMSYIVFVSENVLAKQKGNIVSANK